jgi:enediyne biosynthesis protein E4
VARGAAYGDINNDGALDLLVATNGGPAVLFRNTGTTNNRLRIKLVGTKSNRDGIGATVRVTAGNDGQTKMLRSGSSYLSSSELVLTFGLGTHPQVDSIEIQWPSGAKESIFKVSPNQFITIKESSGIVSSHPLAFAKPAS